MKPPILPLLFVAVVATTANAAPVDERVSVISHLFEGADIVAGPSISDCTLSKGTAAKCFTITVRPFPKERTPGPFCPTNVADGPDKSGIWMNRDAIVDADGSFMKRLPEIYDDDEWQVVEPSTGKVRVTDSAEACAAAARPDVDAQYNNYCVQCLPEYVDTAITTTYSIPLEPVALRSFFGGASSEDTRGAVGVAFDGVRLDAPAPLDAILDAHTVAPFDDCGGHVNLHVGYHYHAVTDCTGMANSSDDAKEDARTIGLALDGHPILSQLTTPTDLDTCNGHTVDGRYHYHAGAAGSNRILPCLIAERGCASESSDATCDATVRERRP
ncbi:YHYH protein [Rhizobiaceae bacterium]|nr:YHYH protein [Rhizobiaceae bacterium]